MDKFLLKEKKNLINDLKKIAQIPSPTFHESKKICYIKEYILKMGCEDISIDGAGNLIYKEKGILDEEIVFSAHVDTVFSESTKLEIIEKEGKIYCPSICDNSVGVVALIYLIKFIKKYNIKPKYNINFLFNVGEEELGNLKGIRYFFDNLQKKVRAHICIEGHKIGRLTTRVVGSYRSKILISSEGGHSWRDYGKPNPILIASQMISEIANIILPAEPKTTINFGTINGGTTVNSIPAKCEFTLEVRSLEKDILSKIVEHIGRIITIFEQDKVNIKNEVLSERPCGEMRDKGLIELIKKVHEELEIKTVDDAGSTDSNYPISLGLPSVTIGITEAEKTHSINEFLYVEPIEKGVLQLIRIFKYLNS